MTRQPRILMNPKDAPWLPSGYGVIAKHLAPRLVDHYGPDSVILYCPVFQRDEVRVWNDITVLPGLSFDFGEDLIETHYSRNNRNMLLQIGDWFPLKTIPQLAAEDKIIWVQWGPHDFCNLTKWMHDTIRFAAKIVPFSKQAEKVFREAGLEQTANAIWIGLDTDLWKPLDRAEFPEVMKSLGFREDTYNILMVQANQQRKYIRESLEGIKHFREAYPQANVRLYLHTHTIRGGDRNLNIDIDDLGLSDITTLPDPYIMDLGGLPEEQMVIVFNCADLVLDVCMEGFGLSHTQAQACGLPVVCLSEGAGPELTKWGIQVPSYSIDRSQPMLKPVPHPAQIATAIETMYLEYKSGRKRNQNAINFVRENLNWDKITGQWFEVIDGVMELGERHCWYIPGPSEGLVEKSREIVEVKS